MRYYILICVLLLMRGISKLNVNATQYNRAQVWRTNLERPNEILILRKLIDNKELGKYPIFEIPTVISTWRLTPTRADFLVKFKDKLHVNKQLSSKNINHTVLILDVERWMDVLKPEEVVWSKRSLRIGHRLNWNQYPTPSLVEEYFSYLSEKFPSICKLRSIGRTAENREIRMVTISNGNPENKEIMVTSGVHGMEWAAITSALYVTEFIVSKFDSLPEHVKNCDWLIIPVVNPDGFEYSYKHDRLWRKNRRELNKCVGVDINRNFGHDWNVGAFTVTNECMDQYAGTNSFSEAESIALFDLVANHTKMPSAVVDLHMYGQMILYPWTSNEQVTKDTNLHKDIAEGMAWAIQNKTGITYTSGAGYRMMYPATGSLIDWFYAAGVPLTFALETQNTANYGYLMPPKDIAAAGKDVLVALSYLAERVEQSVAKEKSVWI